VFRAAPSEMARGDLGRDETQQRNEQRSRLVFRVSASSASRRWVYQFRVLGVPTPSAQMPPRAGGVAGGVGVLGPEATTVLRDALLAACIEVHADAARVLTAAPDAASALPLAWLRPSPSGSGGDGGDLETHVAVALFWVGHDCVSADPEPLAASSSSMSCRYELLNEEVI